MVQHLGSLVVEALTRTGGPVTLFYRDGHLAVATTDDVVLLSELPVDVALRTLAITGRSDEEMEDYLTRREASDPSPRSP